MLFFGIKGDHLVKDQLNRLKLTAEMRYIDHFIQGQSFFLWIQRLHKSYHHLILILHESREQYPLD